MDLIVKPGTVMLHVRVRIASLLAVPTHRVGMTDLDNNEIPLHHPVPVYFRVHDRWVQSEEVGHARRLSGAYGQRLCLCAKGVQAMDSRERGEQACV